MGVEHRNLACDLLFNSLSLFYFWINFRLYFLFRNSFKIKNRNRILLYKKYYYFLDFKWNYFFWCLIFNEVFILNVCGLDFNTNKKIKEREKQIIKKEHHLLTEIMKKEGDIVELTDSENDDKTESSLIS